MKKLIVLALSIIFLAGCKPSDEKAIDIAKKEVAADMKDPDSAKFRYLRFVKQVKKMDWLADLFVGK